MNGLTNTSEVESVQLLQIDQLLKNGELINCQRFHSRLTKDACKKYRQRNPDACRGCANAQRRRMNGIWTRERLLQALLDYARDKDQPVTSEEFKDKFGLNSLTIRREWGSWKELCAAAGLPTARRTGRSNNHRPAPSRSRGRRITVDFADLPDLYEALSEEAQENGRRVDSQILSILKGWFT